MRRRRWPPAGPEWQGGYAMPRFCYTLLASGVLLFAAGADAGAQRVNVGPGDLPRADQMIAVPVGGTHVPVQGQVQQVRNPYEGNVDAIAQGRALFHSMNCIGCHAPQGGGG